MTNFFDDPDIQSAMKRAGVVHTPGLADEVMRDLAPFLAEEGIDLSGVIDADLDTINAAMSRAVDRYNASLPDPGVPRQREPSLPAGVRHIASAPSVSGAGSGSRSRRGGKRGKGVSGHPGRREMDRTDRALTREFERWLRQQEVIAAPSVRDEVEALEQILRAARQFGLDPRTPTDLEELIFVFTEADFEHPDFAEPDGPKSEEVLEAVLVTLDDYIHFQIDSSIDPTAWLEVHDAIEGAMEELIPEDNILTDIIFEAGQIDPELRREALAETMLVSSVTELLDWIGGGLKTAPSGGFRRVDIARGASLLGIVAEGVSKLPPFVPESQPQIDSEDEQPRPLYVQSMLDVPLLPSWLDALRTSEIIGANTYRMLPGLAVDDWLAEDTPPLELAEMVVGMTVAFFIAEERRSRWFGDHSAERTAFRLIRALAPLENPLPHMSDLEQVIDRRATNNLKRLMRVGLLTLGDSGEFTVPEPLRGAVARGILTALSLLSLDLDD